MNIDGLSLILSDTLRASTPLILAALGEFVTEKSGVLNLEFQGMMLVGACDRPRCRDWETRN